MGPLRGGRRHLAGVDDDARLTAQRLFFEEKRGPRNYTFYPKVEKALRNRQEERGEGKFKGRETFSFGRARRKKKQAFYFKDGRAQRFSFFILEGLIGKRERFRIFVYYSFLKILLLEKGLLFGRNCPFFFIKIFYYNKIINRSFRY